LFGHRGSDKKYAMKTLLIGNGYWGKIIKPKLSELTDLIYVADSKTNLDDFFSNHDIDFVFVCVNTDNHYQVVKKCIEYKKNLMCEKPFTGDYEKALELYSLADEIGSNIYVNNIFLLTEVFNNIEIKDFKEIRFIWNKYDINFRENLYDSLLYHDIYMLMKLKKSKWEIKDKKISENNLYLEMENLGSVSKFIYDRNYILRKSKKIIIDDNVFDFLNNSNDSLYETIEKIVDNKIDYQENRRITLETLNLISKIKI
jgi:hypothetical protein